MKIKQAYATETYVSQAGYYVIKQEDEFENRMAVLTSEQMKLLIKDMQDHLDDMSWEGVDPDEIER